MRRTKIVELMDRDRPLKFEIKEMAATELEDWLIRAMLLLGPALGKADGEGVTVTEAAQVMSSQGLRLLSSLDYSKVKPLLNDLLRCCSRIDAGITQPCDPATINGYVQDVRTLLALRKEALQLNLSFFGEGEGSPLNFLKSLNSGERAKVEVSRA